MTRFSRQSGCTRLRLDTFVSRRSLTAIAVRRTPLSPPTLRADARAARYESISPYPIGARYSVIASLVLTAQGDPKTGSSAQMPLPFSLARPLPCSPLRSDNGHRNRDGSLRSPIPSSLCSSLRLPFTMVSPSAQRSDCSGLFLAV